MTATVRVSPKHHEGWLRSKSKQLQKEFTPTTAEKLKKSLQKLPNATTQKWPRAKWNANIKFYAESVEQAVVVKTTLMKTFVMSQLVIHFSDEKLWTVAFFSPMGDPFLLCSIEKKKLIWKKIKLSEKSIKDNRKEYLAKLSVNLKRQMGLIPPLKTARKK